MRLESEVVFSKETAMYITDFYQVIKEFEVDIYKSLLKYEEPDTTPPEKLKLLEILYYDASEKSTILPKQIADSIGKIEYSLKKNLSIGKTKN